MSGGVFSNIYASVFPRSNYEFQQTHEVGINNIMRKVLLEITNKNITKVEDALPEIIKNKTNYGFTESIICFPNMDIEVNYATGLPQTNLPYVFMLESDFKNKYPSLIKLFPNWKTFSQNQTFCVEDGVATVIALDEQTPWSFGFVCQIIEKTKNRLAMN